MGLLVVFFYVSWWTKCFVKSGLYSAIPESNTEKPCCCNRCRLALSWWKIQALPWKRRLDGSICCSNLYIPFSIDGAFPHANSFGTTAPAYHDRCRLLNWMPTASRMALLCMICTLAGMCGWNCSVHRQWWAHVVILMKESWLFIMQCSLRAWRSHISHIDFKLCPLHTEISSVYKIRVYEIYKSVRYVFIYILVLAVQSMIIFASLSNQMPKMSRKINSWYVWICNNFCWLVR